VRKGDIKMNEKSPLVRSLQFSVGLAIGTLIHTFFLSDKQAVDIYRALFVGMTSFIVFIAYFTLTKRATVRK